MVNLISGPVVLSGTPSTITGIDKAFADFKIHVKHSIYEVPTSLEFRKSSSRLMLNGIKSFHEDVPACVKISGETSKYFEIKVG